MSLPRQRFGSIIPATVSTKEEAATLLRRVARVHMGGRWRMVRKARVRWTAVEVLAC